MREEILLGIPLPYILHATGTPVVNTGWLGWINQHRDRADRRAGNQAVTAATLNDTSVGGVAAACNNSTCVVPGGVCRSPLLFNNHSCTVCGG